MSHYTHITHYHSSTTRLTTPTMKTSEISPPASDTESTPPASEKRHTVQFYMNPPQSLARVAVVLRGVDSAFLEKGLGLSGKGSLLDVTKLATPRRTAKIFQISSHVERLRVEMGTRYGSDVGAPGVPRQTFG